MHRNDRKNYSNIIIEIELSYFEIKGYDMSMFNHLCVSNTLWRGLRFELLYITRSTEVIIFLPHFLEVMKRNLQKF